MAERHSDAELYRAWRKGQRSAADTLVRRHFGRVQSSLRRRAADAADDLTQRAFELALGPGSGFDPEANFARYVSAIAFNLCCDHYRRRQRRRVKMREWSVAGNVGGSEFGQLVHADRVTLVRTVVDGLSQDLRHTVQLFYWGGLSTREIADELEIPRSTVTSRLWHARELIRDRLRAREAVGGYAYPTALDYLCW